MTGFLWLTQSADAQRSGQLGIYDVYDGDRYFLGQEQSDGTLRWTEAEIPDGLGPWLERFYFVKKNAFYQETLPTEDGSVDIFRIDLVFDDTPDAAPMYWANFQYDAQGAFTGVSLLVNSGRDDAYTVSESIVTADRQTVLREITGALAEVGK